MAVSLLEERILMIILGLGFTFLMRYDDGYSAACGDSQGYCSFCSWVAQYSDRVGSPSFSQVAEARLE
jgi:hypothetical protein